MFNKRIDELVISQELELLIMKKLKNSNVEVRYVHAIPFNKEIKKDRRGREYASFSSGNKYTVSFKIFSRGKISKQKYVDLSNKLKEVFNYIKPYINKYFISSDTKATIDSKFIPKGIGFGKNIDLWPAIDVSFNLEVKPPKPSLFSRLFKEEKLEFPTVETGDEIKIGKFKNRKAIIKGFDKDKDNQPIIKTNKGDKKALTFKTSNE